MAGHRSLPEDLDGHHGQQEPQINQAEAGVQDGQGAPRPDFLHPIEAQAGHRQDDGEAMQPSLFKRGQNPGHNNERKKETGRHPAETELAQGVKDDQISQSKDQQARQTAFGGPEMPGMES